MLVSFDDLVSKYHMPAVRGVIHVGAHHGWEYKTYKERGIGSIVFVEPTPDSFAALQKNVGPECRLFNTALGNQVGEVEMFMETANMGQSCSILEPGSHVTQYPGIKFEGKITVPITKLDLLPLDVSAYNMLNIDVQGFELEVLKGGEQTVKGLDIIYAEVNRGQLYKGCAQVEDVDAFLAPMGFKRTHTAWIGDCWGDALYLRQA